MNHIYFPIMIIINRIKLQRAVILIEYIANAFSLLFLPKTLIFKKIVLPASVSLNIFELVGNELQKTFSERV